MAATPVKKALIQMYEFVWRRYFSVWRVSSANCQSSKMAAFQNPVQSHYLSLRFNFLFCFLKNIFLFICTRITCVCMCVVSHMECGGGVRGQIVRAGFLLSSRGFWGWIQVIGLDSKCLCLLRHLVGPLIFIFLLRIFQAIFLSPHWKTCVQTLRLQKEQYLLWNL